MLRIVTHIERLLLAHDCVIVPKFGGFILQTVPAVQHIEEHLFRPLRKEISFNMTLQHNDGLLLESYMQMYAVNDRQAQLMLEEDVESIKNTLLRCGKLSLDVLGSFKRGEEGQMIFYPGKTDLFCVSSYGLPVFHFPALEPLQVEREIVPLSISPKERKDIFYIPISRKLIRTAIASAAAVALFLLISTPVRDVNQDAYTASFVPTGMTAAKSVLPEVVSPDSLAIEADAEKKAVTSEEIITNEVKKEIPAHLPKKKVALSKPSTIRPKMYHIVIASFPSETQADEFMAGVDRNECKHVSKVVRDGKYRIYADKFDNRKAAETYMSNLRSNPKYKDAWLFISR